MSPEPLPESALAEPRFQALGSRDFPAWLAQMRLSLALTTYQANKLLLIGLHPDGRLAAFERTFNRCMGLFGDAQTLWLSSLYQIWRCENILGPGESYQGGDRLYVPMVGYTTGDIDTHDIAVEVSGRVVFVATRFNCLATLGDRCHFTPLWRPPFVSKLIAEDRCHLNGLALENGKAAYVTAISTSDVAESWRDHRRDGGVVVDVRSNEIVARGLSMPHSPRVYRGKLWLLNTGTGYFGYIDLAKGAFEPVTFCPGFLRGLTFVGDYAIVGLSGPRHDNATFGGLALDDELVRRGESPRGGLHIIDLRTGAVAHWLRLEGMVTELYDVVALPNVARPMALGFKSDEIQRLFTVGKTGSL